jgi:hypothetical protein
MRSIREEIARSHQTVDNDPFQYDDNDNVKVEKYANDIGTWSVKVDCTTDPSLSFPLKKFPDEGSADHYARQCCDRIIRKTMNESQYSLMQRIYPKPEHIMTEGLINFLQGIFGKFMKGLQGELEKSQKTVTSKLSKQETGNWMDDAIDYAEIESPNTASQLVLTDKAQRKAWIYWWSQCYQSSKEGDMSVILGDDISWDPESEDIKSVLKNLSAHASIWLGRADLMTSSRFRPELDDIQDLAMEAHHFEDPGTLIQKIIKLLEAMKEVFVKIQKTDGLDKLINPILKISSTSIDKWNQLGKNVAENAKEQQKEYKRYEKLANQILLI